MRNKTLVAAVAAALLTSGAAMAQEKGPGTGIDPEGPSNGNPEGLGALPGILCSAAGGTNCAAAIPDSSGAGPGEVSSTMNLQNCSGPITDVNVGLDATHTWVGDLIFSVTAPDLTEVTIFDRPGVPASTFGCSGNDIFAVLDDAAGAPVENECGGGVPTINGTFIPNEALSAFNGLDANGEWTLTVSDNAGGDTGSLNDWSLEIAPEGCEGGAAEPQEPRATFGVQKIYDDFNPTPVEVTLSCNTGLPLEQTTTLEPDPTGEEYIEFIVNDFADGEMDCEITEVVPDGYFGFYNWAEDGQYPVSDTGCVFDDVEHGDFADTTPQEEDNFCIIINLLEPSTVTVTKEWIDEGMQFTAPNYAEASWFCSNLPDFLDFSTVVFPGLDPNAVVSNFEGNGNTASGNLEFIGNPGVDGFAIPGNWDGGTMCDVTEQVVEGGVETDDSDCQGLVIGPGEDVACTIVNTRLFEGIPTLSQYGLGLLALLMLGMGFVAYRRIV